MIRSGYGQKYRCVVTLNSPWPAPCAHRVRCSPYIAKTAPADICLPPPPCPGDAKVPNQYGPYACCGLDKGAACARHKQLPSHMPPPKKGEDNAQLSPKSELCGFKWANTHNKCVHDSR